MNLICDRCGKDAFDHTARELSDMRCIQLMEKKRPSFTAVEVGFVNPEAVENTGERFDLRHWRPDFYVPERAQRFADVAEAITRNSYCEEDSH